MSIAEHTQAGLVRYTHIACAVLVAYEHVLQIENEVELFWKKRWTLAKFLFLWNRGQSLVLSTSSAALFLYPRPSHNLCNRFFYWRTTGGILLILATHVILSLRLYAMYGSTRKMLIFLIVMVSIEAVIIVFAGIPRAFGTFNRAVISQPYPGLYICSIKKPPGSVPFGVTWYSTILLVDAVLLALALVKAWEQSFIVKNPLMRQLTRDSVVYFLMLFWIYLANVIIWAKNYIILNQLAVPFSFALSSVLANRLLIRVRSAYFRGFPQSNADTGLSAMRFSSPELPSSVPSVSQGDHIRDSDLELRVFNERIGI